MTANCTKFCSLRSRPYSAKLISAAKCDGMPISARWITETVLAHVG